MQKAFHFKHKFLFIPIVIFLVLASACRPAPGTPTATPGSTATSAPGSTETPAPAMTQTLNPAGTSSPTPQGQSPVFPLKMSPDKSAHYLVDQNGNPFLIHGDTPWSLIGQVSYEDAVYYIDDAAAKGFNSLIVTLVEGHYADNAPNNYYNTPPFLTPNKISTPNPAYFDHADRVIKYAASKGINVIIAPLYLGCCDDGWLDAFLNKNTDADAKAYGEFIGNRYQDIPNIMYVWGNDHNPDSKTLENRLLVMVNAAKSKDPNHLHTYHWLVNPAYELWYSHWDYARDVNNVYAYDAIQDAISTEYNESPVVPFFLFESGYENEHDSPPLQQRKQAYVAVLGGAGGEFYGNNPIWHMGFLGGDWKAALNDEARTEMPYVKKLFDSRPWYTFTPDQDHAILTDGYASGSDFAPAAATKNNQTFIAYLPTSRKITIDMSKIQGSNSNAWWYNPRTGEAQSAGTHANSGSQNFTPPDANDWVLVIDDAAAGFGAPGN
jgi:hypothetical protein